ncbi:NADP-dependent oxidoreductase [Candidatus Enterococcus murrayae]|uniref:NADP-dependent oxidoreductase n=1 Tax=Candidatus Enterococcus murrayae TaxID=2815321 RepID=A0ABS3HE48_9ENTE|nr:NADP-dependent oxidoreductase [Enterococcus sp. MJM16]MBO0451731.1 NADP-dependent oxidoreductase [Enterococcus sp. MJM16]
MKRFAIKDYGPASDVLIEIEAEPRLMDDTHVRVELTAFAINPYDVALRQGAMRDFRTLKFPYVLGNDGAGIVTEVGSKITHVKVGDEVIVHAVGGTYGEEVVVPGKKIVRKPVSMSWEVAAGAVTPWLTAYNLVTHLLGDTIGGTVMVQGASGAVGSLLVQFLKKQGKTVLASASKRNETLVRQLGADQFVAYDEEDAGKIFADQADSVIDATKGGRAGEAGMEIMKAGGNFVALNDLPSEQKKPGNYLSFGPSKDYSDFDALTALTELADTIHLTIAEVLPFTLASVIAGHEKLEGHPAAGKIIIKKER